MVSRGREGTRGEERGVDAGVGQSGEGGSSSGATLGWELPLDRRAGGSVGWVWDGAGGGGACVCVCVW